MQTLANWRYRDRMAGRSGALPGYPQYRRFGRAIRYWIEDEQNGGAVMNPVSTTTLHPEDLRYAQRGLAPVQRRTTVSSFPSRYGIPDLRFINRKLPIIDVARALNLRIGTNGHIHCWHPERHQKGDRTAFVGIRKTNNTVKCFGCDVGPLGPADLVMDVLALENPGDAARWIAERFQVPELPSDVGVAMGPPHK